MNGPFFDTNILLYLISDHPSKTEQVDPLLMSGGVISVQVLNEFARVGRRKMRLEWPKIQAGLEVLKVAFHVIPINLETHEHAITIAQRYGFDVFDSVLLASALEAECTVFLSEDMQHGQWIEDRLTIINPFL